MKILNNKRYIVLVMIGLTYILVGALEMLKILPASGLTSPGVSYMASGIIILAIGLYLSRKPESEVMIDERIKKRAMKVYAGAFTTVLIYVTLLTLMDVLWSANLIDLGDFFLIFSRPDIMSIFSRYLSIIGVAVISVAAFWIYYNKKGDAE